MRSAARLLYAAVFALAGLSHAGEHNPSLDPTKCAVSLIENAGYSIQMTDSLFRSSSNLLPWYRMRVSHMVRLTA
jgi:hypothetical protein